MNVDDKGIQLIKSFEGCKLEAYQDAVGIWTIGYGHTGPFELTLHGVNEYFSGVVSGIRITQEEAESILKQDLDKFEKGIIPLIHVPLTQNQFNALVSFSFNVGINAFKNSTMRSVLNKKNYDEAANQFKRWNKAGKKQLKGLTRRRRSEAYLFVTGHLKTDWTDEQLNAWLGK